MLTLKTLENQRAPDRLLETTKSEYTIEVYSIFQCLKIVRPSRNATRMSTKLCPQMMSPKETPVLNQEKCVGWTI